MKGRCLLFFIIIYNEAEGSPVSGGCIIIYYFLLKVECICRVSVECTGCCAGRVVE